MNAWATRHFEGLLGLIVLAVVVRLGMVVDWSVTASEALMYCGCLLAALITVGVWHRATRRRNH